MVVCPKCKKEHTADSSFCGYCGASLMSAHIVLDGRKNKKKIDFLNRLYSSDKENILYIILSGVALILMVALGIYTLTLIVSEFSALEYHLGQIAAKYEYINEGVGISYIASSLSFVINYILYEVILLGIVINIPVVIFNIVFGCYILYYKKRKVFQFGIQKPVTLVKTKLTVSKIAALVNTVVLGVFVLVLILKYYFM